jgi:F0F1-type ATP synthase membrane subunit c/vacuolar-type H+-ATPase subunit K
MESFDEVLTFNVIRKEHKMKISTIAAALLLGMSVAVTASAQDALTATTQQIVAQSPAIPMQGRVVSVDRASNTMIVQGPMGNQVQMPLVNSAKTGAPVTAGDKVDVEYKDAVAIDVQKLDEPTNGIRKRVDTGVFVPHAAGYEVAHQVEVEATVQDIDVKDRTLKLRGAYQPVTVQVAKGVEMGHVRRGDTVRLVFVSAYAVSAAQS